MKKEFWPIVAVAMIIIGVVAVACSKDSEKSAPDQESTFALSPKTEGKIMIGKLHGDQPICGVVVEEFSNALWEETGIYVAEKFEILDSFPHMMNGYAEIHMVLFNVETEAVESIWIPIEKNDGGYFYADSPTGVYDIICEKERFNKCDKECWKKMSNGVFIGCECKGTKGSCVPKVVRDRTFWDNIGEAIREAAKNMHEWLKEIF